MHYKFKTSLDIEGVIVHAGDLMDGKLGAAVAVRMNKYGKPTNPVRISMSDMGIRAMLMLKWMTETPEAAAHVGDAPKVRCQLAGCGKWAVRYNKGVKLGNIRFCSAEHGRLHANRSNRTERNAKISKALKGKHHVR